MVYRDAVFPTIEERALLLSKEINGVFGIGGLRVATADSFRKGRIIAEDVRGVLYDAGYNHEGHCDFFGGVLDSDPLSKVVSCDQYYSRGNSVALVCFNTASRPKEAVEILHGSGHGSHIGFHMHYVEEAKKILKTLRRYDLPEAAFQGSRTWEEVSYFRSEIIRRHEDTVFHPLVRAVRERAG
jgi:hypothetical protein